jgi:probable HAF family extracellular repeat protein
MQRTVLTMMSAVLMAAAGSARAQSVQMLSSLGGAGSIAWGINNDGDIVGESVLADGTTVRATRWGVGLAASDLGVADGATHSVAYAINDRGTVVGYSEFASGLRTATMWPGTPRGGRGGRGDLPSVVDLGAQMGAVGSSVAWDVNNFGTVVGQASFTGGFAKGFVWDDVKGGRTAGMSQHYQGGANRGINDSGVIVGSAFFFGDPDDAFLCHPDGLGGYGDSDIAPPGYNLSIATDISNTDICVGFTSFGVDVGWQAAIFEGRGAVTLLGTLDGLENSEANAVNDHGLIVGTAWDNDFELPSAAWAWVDGTMYDLNSHLRGDSGFMQLLSATGVNEHGDIVGYGVLHDGSLSGFVIRGFVPAPGTAGLLAMGLSLAARRRRA